LPVRTGTMTPFALTRSTLVRFIIIKMRC
jgi:hypothetical protein